MNSRVSPLNFRPLPGKSTFVMRTQPDALIISEDEERLTGFLNQCQQILGGLGKESIKRGMEPRGNATPLKRLRATRLRSEEKLDSTSTQRKFIRPTIKRGLSLFVQQKQRLKMLEKRYTQQFPQNSKYVVEELTVISNRRTPRHNLRYTKLQPIQISQHQPLLIEGQEHSSQQPQSIQKDIESASQNLITPKKQVPVEVSSVQYTLGTDAGQQSQAVQNQIEKYFSQIQGKTKVELARQRLKQFVKPQITGSSNNQSMSTKLHQFTLAEQEEEYTHLRPSPKLMRIKARGYRLFQKLKISKY